MNTSPSPRTRQDRLKAARRTARRRSRLRRAGDLVTSAVIGCLLAGAPLAAGAILRWAVQPQLFRGAYGVGDVLLYCAAAVAAVVTVVAYAALGS